MSAVPAVPDFGVGPLPATQLAQLAAVLRFLQQPPAADVRQAGAQSIPNNSWTALTFDAADLDSANGHDPVSNNSRYTAVYPGWYQVSGGYVPTGNVTGLRGTRWAINGAALNGSATLEVPASSATAYAARTKQLFLGVGDYVELQVFQSSGGALLTTAAVESQSHMSVRWVSN